MFKSQNTLLLHSKNKYFKAFSLIEISIVLTIIGVMLGAMFHGQELLDSAKIQSVVSEYQKINLAIHSYKESYGFYPGDDPKASERFIDVSNNGNGNHIIDESESNIVWQHLKASGNTENSTSPTSRFGGNFEIVYNPDSHLQGHWIKLSNPQNSGILTPKQAQKLKTKIDGNHSVFTEGYLQIKDDGSDECIKSGALNANSTKSSCITFMKIS
ncbi:MAG: hypothetical protein C0432_05045 [Candidatus Puniceispirillum sp.]|nr:hypothetical protein [Candidatus Pelagibacter sp.]MBA4283641.1 hypothetical protein [Candidatus Puniceispirillum sp.]